MPDTRKIEGLKKQQQKKIQITGDRDTRMTGPDTRKIEGLKKKIKKKNKKTKKHTNHGGSRHRNGKARYTENRRTKKRKDIKKEKVPINRAATNFFPTSSTIFPGHVPPGMSNN